MKRRRRDYEWEIRVAWAVVLGAAILAFFALAAYLWVLHHHT